MCILQNGAIRTLYISNKSIVVNRYTALYSRPSAYVLQLVFIGNFGFTVFLELKMSQKLNNHEELYNEL